jgi:alpha-amylase
MNVLADFIVRVEEQYPMNIEDEELNSLLTTIRNQAREIEDLNKELTTYRLNEEHYNEEHLLREKPASPAKEKAEKPAKAEKAPAKPRAKRTPKA